MTSFNSIAFPVADRVKKRAREEDMQLRFPLQISSFCPVWCSGFDAKHNTAIASTCRAMSARVKPPTGVRTYGPRGFIPKIPKITYNLPNYVPAPVVVNTSPVVFNRVGLTLAKKQNKNAGLASTCSGYIEAAKEYIEEVIAQWRIDATDEKVSHIQQTEGLEEIRNALVIIGRRETELASQINEFSTTAENWYTQIQGVIAMVDKWNSEDEIDDKMDRRLVKKAMIKLLSGGLDGDDDDGGEDGEIDINYIPKIQVDTSVLRSLCAQNMTYVEDMLQGLREITSIESLAEAEDIRQGFETMLNGMNSLQSEMQRVFDLMNHVNGIYEMAVTQLEAHNIDSSDGEDLHNIIHKWFLYTIKVKGMMEELRGSGFYALVLSPDIEGMGLIPSSVSYMQQVLDYSREYEIEGADWDDVKVVRLVKSHLIQALEKIVKADTDILQSIADAGSQLEEWRGEVTNVLSEIQQRSSVPFVHNPVQLSAPVQAFDPLGGYSSENAENKQTSWYQLMRDGVKRVSEWGKAVPGAVKKAAADVVSWIRGPDLESHGLLYFIHKEVQAEIKAVRDMLKEVTKMHGKGVKIFLTRISNEDSGLPLRIECMKKIQLVFEDYVAMEMKYITGLAKVPLEMMDSHDHGDEEGLDEARQAINRIVQKTADVQATVDRILRLHNMHSGAY